MNHSLQKLALAVIETEAQEILSLKNRINNDFVLACETILACKGRIVVTGMGKSGHIGNKIAATLASTGTPAFFVHPGEASHGDLGMITHEDVVIAISNSGESEELLIILPIIKRLAVPLISMTGNKNSALAKAATCNIDISVTKEACPLGLAPTSSTTATLVMGDALAVSILDARGFTADDFARSHPGGRLGRRLLVLIEDVMHKDDDIPYIHENCTLPEALAKMTEKGLGLTIVTDKTKKVLGVFTDGDLRRVLDNEIDYHKTIIKNVMTANCKTIKKDMLAAEALQMMESKKINAFPVVDEQNNLIGVVNMHDLLRAGV